MDIGQLAVQATREIENVGRRIPMHDYAAFLKAVRDELDIRIEAAESDATRLEDSKPHTEIF